MGEVTVSTAQNGEALTLRLGDSIALHLPENPSSGYRWALDVIDESRLAVEGTGYRSAGAAPGSGGDAWWTLRARAPGVTRLALKRFRHWEGDASIVERFRLSVTITAD